MSELSYSKKLIQFIKQFHIKSTKLSASSKIMISEIITTMEKATSTASSTFSDKGIILDLYFDKSFDFPKGESYDYITPEIMEDFENTSKIGKHYSFSIGIRTFNIYIIKPCENDNDDNKKKMYHLIDKMIHKIYVWLFVCNHYANSECSPIINIYIYLTNSIKMLPSFHNSLHTSYQLEIDRHNANTAFTLACPHSKNEIYIYRFEEWFKVLIHESFHCFGLDFARMSQEMVHKKMFSIFPINYDLRFYETYCEMWAEIINIIFISVNSYSSNETKINMNKLIKTIENHLYLEQMFSLFQCAKVLNFYGLTYRDILQKSNKIHYKEKTSVFSYYILKSIVMFYYNDFIEWCYIHNNKSLEFTKTQNNINQFFEFIKTRYNSDEYINSISIFENWFSNQNQNENNSRRHNTFILNTLRMSISE
jgi:hypothetical protein